MLPPIKLTMHLIVYLLYLFMKIDSHVKVINTQMDWSVHIRCTVYKILNNCTTILPCSHAIKK